MRPLKYYAKTKSISRFERFLLYFRKGRWTEDPRTKRRIYVKSMGGIEYIIKEDGRKMPRISA